MIVPLAAVMRLLIETMTLSMDENLQMGFLIQTVIHPMNVVRFEGTKDMTGRHEHASIRTYRSNYVMLSFYRTDLK